MEKKYKKHNNYAIEIDFEKEIFLFGDKIISENKTTQNFSQAENWVVLECVNRLLEKGYQPENLILEKTWKTGHGTSGRLDILVKRDDGRSYLMIECKTWGTEFENASKKLKEDGGQLFTYFQQDKNTDIMMLYTSELDGKEVKYRNEIVKIEDHYRQAGNVKDFFERWNKSPKSNGVFDNWASAYEFQSKALTKNDLKVLKQEDSSFIFNRFLEILRHNVVSDKPNAFNKIFTLFLCKIVDENRNEDEQLHFQWIEGEDNHESFQKRLTDLYNRGMLELLEKKVTDVSDMEFEKQFQQVEDRYKNRFQEILTEIRLKKNNEFAIKEVYDDASFEENAKVVKEVVELLQVYKIRYNYRQQFLSDFFELLLTTGLKQESGQFFTPVPIARFIIKSLPFQEITTKKIDKRNTKDLLPTVMDYAAGSGHFLTEFMEEIQKYIDNLNESKFNPTTKRAIKKWKEDQFDWAEDYVYGIEKDYRLVKTVKVSCYLHGDGLAKVIHGDGLADFSTSTEYKDLLKETDKTYPQDNKQFDIIISNPPYSVSAFKGLMDKEKSKRGFDLYDSLTDKSKEIECLFIERTKQLLKDGGVAGIILPSSILSNTGIYTQAREILLRYFEVIAIAKMGSKTFMATGTNTVAFFLRRRNNADPHNIEEAIKKVFSNLKDVTINGIETPLQKYLYRVWDDISLDDYRTLINKFPNDNIKKHEVYREYDRKIKGKNDQEKWDNIIDLEKEKFLYFIIALPQKVVLIETGEGDKEKQFLGYEFSKRRGSEGIHPIKRTSTIDDCTHLYDANEFNNPDKVSTYILKAFNHERDLEIPEHLKENINYQNLADMLTFDRSDFEKSISLSSIKKNTIQIESKWEQVKIKDFSADIIAGGEAPKEDRFSKTINEHFSIPVYSNGIKKDGLYGYTDKARIKKPCVTVSARGTIGFSRERKKSFYPIVSLIAVIPQKDKALPKYLELIFNRIQFEQYAVGIPQLTVTQISEYKIPLPPLNIQENIVAENLVLEKQKLDAIKKIENLKGEIDFSLQELLNNANKTIRLSDTELFEIKIGKRVLKREIKNQGKYPVYSANVFEPFGFIDKDLLTDFSKSSVVWGIDGDWMVNVIPANRPFYPTDHCGYLRIKKPIAKARYIAFCLDKEAQQIGFSRTIRASINRIKGIKIPLPKIEEQKKIIAEIEKIEDEIKILENKNDKIEEQKKDILKKYL